MQHTGGKKTSKVIIADTSFLLLPFNLKINIILELDRILEGSYELIVPDFCIKELSELKKRGGKIRKGVNLAMAIIRKHAKILQAHKGIDEEVDRALVRLAKNMKAIVATCDSELRKALRKEGIPVIYPRAYKKLEINGVIE